MTVATIIVPVGLTLVRTEPEEQAPAISMLGRVPVAASSYDPSGLDLKPSEELFNYTTPAPPAPIAVAAPAPALSETQATFLAGWYDAGGGAYKGDAAVVRFVACESTWYIVTTGNFLGLAQYLPSTWAYVAAITGFWDWTNPYHHGYNTGYWYGVSDPTQQWPNCWYV